MAFGLWRVTTPVDVPLDTRTCMSFPGNRNISVALFQKYLKKFLEVIPHYYFSMPLFSVISSKFSSSFCGRLW